MLTASRLPGTAVVRLDLDDGLDEEAVRAARVLIEGVVEERGGARLLVVLARLGGITLGSLRADLERFGEIGGIERVALVTDAAWLRLAARTRGSSLGLELRAFRGGAADEALTWAST